MLHKITLSHETKVRDGDVLAILPTISGRWPPPSF